MAGKISEYANAVATFADGDLVDVSKRLSTSPDVFQSQKLEFAQFQAFIQANASNILNTNGLTLGGMYSHNLNSNYLTFTNGTLNISQGSLLVQAETNLGSTAVLFKKQNGDTMWNFLDNGNLNIGGNSTIDLDTHTLTFENSGASSNFKISTAGNSYSLFNRSGGLKIRPDTLDPIVVTNTGDTLDTFTVKKNGGGSWSAYNGVKIGELTSNDFAQFTIDDLNFYKANVIQHKIGFGVNTSDVDFWVNGATANNSFRVGGSNLIDLESISLKGKTIIQGAGTSTGSALSIYDNDTTPVKLWDFLDNGNVNLGVDSVINQDSNVLQFSNINSIGGLKFNGTSNNGIGLNLANGTDDFDFVVAGSSNTLIGTGSLGLLTGNTWKVQITQTGKVSIGSNFEPITGYDLSVEGGIRTNGQLRAITSLVGNSPTAIAGYDLVVDNKSFFGNEFSIVSPAGTMQFNGYRSQNTVPNTATFPNDKDLGIHKNTSTGVISLAYNDGGTIKTVQLT